MIVLGTGAHLKPVAMNEEHAVTWSRLSLNEIKQLGQWTQSLIPVNDG